MGPGLAIAFELPIAGGICVGVHLPDEIPEGTPGVHEEEWRVAAAFGAVRRRTWLGGRIALREALGRLSAPTGQPIGSTARGAPILPPGFVGSVSHKSKVAVGLVAPDRGQYVGVDVEEPGPPRLHLAPRLLTPSERDELARLPEPDRGFELILRFSAKEALYKAIDPWVQRYVGFQEVAIERTSGIELRVREWASPDLRSLEARGEWRQLPGYVLTTFAARPSRR